jgi:hypothetical protein
MAAAYLQGFHSLRFRAWDWDLVFRLWNYSGRGQGLGAWSLGFRLGVLPVVGPHNVENRGFYRVFPRRYFHPPCVLPRGLFQHRPVHGRVEG